MRAAGLALAAGGALSLAGAAHAEGWSTYDLGLVDTEAECLQRSVSMFETFGQRYSFHSVAEGGWTVAGYDLTEDDYDGHVACVFGPNDTTRAILNVYSNGSADPQTRFQIADDLRGIWNE